MIEVRGEDARILASVRAIFRNDLLKDGVGEGEIPHFLRDVGIDEGEREGFLEGVAEFRGEAGCLCEGIAYIDVFAVFRNEIRLLVREREVRHIVEDLGYGNVSVEQRHDTLKLLFNLLGGQTAIEIFRMKQGKQIAVVDSNENLSLVELAYLLDDAVGNGVSPCFLLEAQESELCVERKTVERRIVVEVAAADVASTDEIVEECIYTERRARLESAEVLLLFPSTACASLSSRSCWPFEGCSG